MTFAQWRSTCRMEHAAELLRRGRSVEYVAHASGFRSRSGLVRAFRARFDQTPSVYLNRRDLKSESGLGVARRLATTPASTAVQPAAPYHVLTWMYRGKGRARIGDGEINRPVGDVTWLPAGTAREVSLEEGALALPVGVFSSAGAEDHVAGQAHFAPAWTHYLLHCAVSGITSLRPQAYDQNRIRRIFAERVAADEVLAARMPVTPAAHRIAQDYLRRLDDGDFEHLGVTGDVQIAFRRETSLSFQEWCAAVRMRIARDMLMDGATLTAIARRVGYSHISNFSRAFSRFHGVSPKEYRERELESPL